MTFKRILGIILFVCGIVMIFVSNYIKDQVAEGTMQIQSGQKKVDTMNSVMSVNPYTKKVGKMATSSAQKKINAGWEDVDYYTKVANWLMTGGIVVAVVGVGVFFIGGKKKK